MSKQELTAKFVAACRWAIARPSYMLLTASDEALSAQAPRRFANAWAGVMVLSFALGVLLAALWGLSWRLFRESDILFMPAGVTLVVFVLWPFRRGISALTEIIAGPGATHRGVVSALLVGMLTLCLLGLRRNHYHGEAPLPGLLAWVRPSVELYRVLILMPFWGGWGMLIVGQFCRPTGNTEPAVAAFVRGYGPMATAACMLAPAMLTWGYFHFLNGWWTTMPAVTIVAAIAGGIAAARRTGGLKRSTLLATNVLTQVAFMLTYLANR